MNTIQFDLIWPLDPSWGIWASVCFQLSDLRTTALPSDPDAAAVEFKFYHIRKTAKDLKRKKKKKKKKILNSLTLSLLVSNWTEHITGSLMTANSETDEAANAALMQSHWRKMQEPEPRCLAVLSHYLIVSQTFAALTALLPINEFKWQGGCSINGKCQCVPRSCRDWPVKMKSPLCQSNSPPWVQYTHFHSTTSTLQLRPAISHTAFHRQIKLQLYSAPAQVQTFICYAQKKNI